MRLRITTLEQDVRSRDETVSRLAANLHSRMPSAMA